MGYSTKQEVVNALANALSKGSPTAPNTVTPIVQIGSLLTTTATDADINQYIRWSDDNIDAALSSLYQVPLIRMNHGTYRLAMDATTADTALIVEDASRFTGGDVIVIRDDVNLQELTVSGTTGENTIDLAEPLTDSYTVLGTSVERIRYPDPIPKISARMAAATFYDKHFAAQVEGNKSEYGKALRELANADLNAILSGIIRLTVHDSGQFMGRRYYNHALDDAIATKMEPKKFFGEG
jgi:hypothetical protein